MNVSAEDVLHFWFRELEPRQWFEVDRALDERVTQDFAAVHAAATRAELYPWRESPRGRLAEVIVLDQFSRNIYRGRAQAFAWDHLALVLAQEAVRTGAAVALDEPMHRGFLYMPYMHSESPLIHEVALQLFDEPGLEEQLKYEKRHREIIRRFGRYPHRNAVLGRESTEEELAFLEEPGSAF